MLFQTIIEDEKIIIPKTLIDKYNIAAPRYTSYPTAPVWSSKFSATDYGTQLGQLTNSVNSPNLSLYFHIPFCKSRCVFCGCSTIATKRNKEAEKYSQALVNEIKIIRSKLSKKLNTIQIHFGGGTPTYLNNEQMEIIWRAITDNFKIDSNAETGIEIDPRVTTKEQLKFLKGLGFNRISIGVQDFSEEVQKIIGRTETFEEIKDFVHYSRALKFESINIDLIYGLPGQTPSSFTKTIDNIIELSPDRIACFNFAYLPKMLPHQRKIPNDKLPNTYEKFLIFCETVEKLGQNGYQFIGMDHFAKKSDELSIAANNKTLWRNFQGYTTKSGTKLIAFGLTSISDLNGCYAQNTKKLIDYYKKIEEGKPATVKGWKLSEDDIKRRKIIRNLFCTGEADMSTIQDYDFEDLKHDGLIIITNSLLKVTPLGRLFIRNIASVFDKYLGETNKFSKTI